MIGVNCFSWEEIQIGQECAFQVQITQEMLDGFREISKDVNPLHTDSEYAKRRGYKGRVAYGMLTASFLSTLAGVYLPGEKCLLQGVEVAFANPVFIGDELRVHGIVKEKNNVFRQMVMKCRITNQKGECVCRGKIKAGVV